VPAERLVQVDHARALARLGVALVLVLVHLQHGDVRAVVEDEVGPLQSLRISCSSFK
jgi:hypothetical protein